MLEFTFENQGVNTYLVYQLGEEDIIDTLSIGMISNNKINGLAPLLYTQLNNQKTIKFNISSKITVNQFLLGTITKNRVLGTFSSIAESLLNLDDYMIDLDSILLDPEYIYADVSTCKVILISLPIIKAHEPNDFLAFFKNMVYGAQFDQSENCSYVARIINYLNSTGVFSLLEFKKLLDDLMMDDKPVVNQSVINQASTSQISTNSAMVNQTVTNQTQPNQGFINQTFVNQASLNQASPTVPTNLDIPSSIQTVQNQSVINTTQVTDVGNKEAEKKKKGWSLFGKREKSKDKPEKTKEKPDKIKEKSEKTKEKPEKVKAPSNIKNYPGAPVHKEESSMVHPSVQTINSKKPTVQGMQPSINTINTQKAPEPMVLKPQAQVPTTSVQNSQNFDFNSQAVLQRPNNFGETTVLGGAAANGETTVLSMNPTVETNPYLVRSKNNEKIKITKSIFKIGKEKSYVDYFIGDNTAISRSHANIINSNNEYFVVDTNSTNHTYVDGAMIQSNVNVKLSHGTKIRLANDEFEFRIY